MIPFPFGKPECFFNTAGPVDCDMHYCLPALERFDINEILTLIQQQRYFVLHAPRQTGKTTYLKALAKYLNESGYYHCLYINVETGQAARGNIAMGIQAVLSTLGESAYSDVDDPYPQSIWQEIFRERGSLTALNVVLSRWARHSPKPIVLFSRHAQTVDGISSLFPRTLGALGGAFPV